MNREKRVVAVISQHERQSLVRAEHDVEIAIGFNVDGPPASIGSIGHRFRQLGLRGYVGEHARAVLAKQTHAARARQHEISFEIVIEVDLQNSLGRGGDVGRSAGEEKRCLGGQMHFSAIGFSNSFTIPIPFNGNGRGPPLVCSPSGRQDTI